MADCRSSEKGRLLSISISAPSSALALSQLPLPGWLQDCAEKRERRCRWQWQPCRKRGGDAGGGCRATPYRIQLIGLRFDLSERSRRIRSPLRKRLCAGALGRSKSCYQDQRRALSRLSEKRSSCTWSLVSPSKLPVVHPQRAREVN